jgi:spore maturation protein SpmA
VREFKSISGEHTKSKDHPLKIKLSGMMHLWLEMMKIDGGTSVI